MEEPNVMKLAKSNASHPFGNKRYSEGMFKFKKRWDK
jgi:hypothetical protein